jgi:hypothetical protein
LELDRGFQLTHRLRRIGGGQNGTEILVRIGVVGPKLHGLAKRSDGFLIVTRLHVDQAEVVVDLRIVRAQPDSFFECCRDLRCVRACGAEQSAEDAICIRGIGLLCDRPPQFPNRDVQIRNALPFGKVQSSLELSCGAIKLALAQEHDSEIEIRQGRLRGESDGALEHFAGAIEIAILAIDHAEKAAGVCCRRVQT